MFDQRRVTVEIVHPTDRPVYSYSFDASRAVVRRDRDLAERMALRLAWGRLEHEVGWPIDRDRCRVRVAWPDGSQTLYLRDPDLIDEMLDKIG